ncbi:MAG: aldo/keto reductase [Alphaproteobacteria bacterium]|nr:aldo/keto reductase [Alphaproteobacteria bacterium]
MKFSPLGRTGLSVSRVCLGTMTWGQQNSESEAHEQMNYGVSRGINFFDTAELYAVPTSAATQGKTEEYIGTWFKKSGQRDKIILATKVAGPGLPWIRKGSPITGQSVHEAIEGSLKRLQTDYVDLYQLHWPNRPFPHFGLNHAGEIDFTAHKTAEIEDNLLDILQALGDIVKQGKVRYIGLSDDTAWGIMKYLSLSDRHHLPRMHSIQNEYSLLNRSDDPYVAEVCVREEVSYLPWSPLACGLLSGKYAGGKIPPGSRWDHEKRMRDNFDSFRNVPQTHQAVADYMAVAKKHGLDVCQMALKAVDLQTFVTSTIIGATNMTQLKSNIDAFDITLSPDVMKDIDTVYKSCPIPY